jgi:hypothetical protein
MFEFLERSISNALDIGDSLISGEDITKAQVARLISDGMTLYTISTLTGLGVDVLKDMLDE